MLQHPERAPTGCWVGEVSQNDPLRGQNPPLICVFKPSVLAEGSERDAGGMDRNAHSVRSEMWCLGSSRCLTKRYGHTLRMFVKSFIYIVNWKQMEEYY